VAEYEALVLGLRATKDMGIEEISMFGDPELIIQQIINIYQAKHPQLRSYRCNIPRPNPVVNVNAIVLNLVSCLT
jgi:ribonuclease HI